MTAPEWRVAAHLGPGGEVRERHAYRDLAGQTAQAVCEQTTLTDRLSPDDAAMQLCPLCALLVGDQLADLMGDGEQWGR